MYELSFAPPYTMRGKVRHELYNYWLNYLFNVRLRAVFSFNIPDTWDEDYLFYNLFFRGYLPVVQTKYGALALEGTLHGNNPYGKESMVHVINRGITWDIDVEAEIGKTCTVLAPFTDRKPQLMPIVADYAYTLSNMTTSMQMSILNSRLAYAFAAKDKASANTIKDIMDRVYKGEPAVTYMKLLGRPSDHSEGENWNFVELHPQNAYLADKMISDRQTLLAEFDKIIGLPIVNNKKERMLVDEVDTQNSGNFSIAEKIAENLQKQFDQTNQMFGLNLSVKLNKGDDDNGSKDNDNGLHENNES